MLPRLLTRLSKYILSYFCLYKNHSSLLNSFVSVTNLISEQFNAKEVDGQNFLLFRGGVL